MQQQQQQQQQRQHQLGAALAALQQQQLESNQRTNVARTSTQSVLLEDCIAEAEFVLGITEMVKIWLPWLRKAFRMLLS